MFLEELYDIFCEQLCLRYDMISILYDRMIEEEEN